MRRRDLPILLKLVADALYAYGYFLLAPLAVAVAVGEWRQAALFGGAAALFIPGFWLLRRRTSSEGAQKRHAAMALALTWTALSLLSCIPFLGEGMGLLDAMFESFSAWTDTGLTMVPQPESLSVSVNVFRVLMQWVSGLGIVILMLFLYGPTSRAAQSLFQAEGRFEDFDTNIWRIGRTIILIYLGYTAAGAVLFLALGMPPFEALMHAITSLSTGGFSTNSIGVGVYGALPSVVAMLLMLLGGISFGSHQALLSGKVRKLLRNPEVRALATIVVAVSALLVLEQYLAEGEVAGRVLTSVFYTVSAVSTCGAGTTLPLHRAPDVYVFTVLLLMISGAAYGSTTGALKLWRLIIIGKVIGREIRRPFYPAQAVLPITMGNNRIPGHVVIEVTAYALLYLGVGLAGSLVFMLFGHRPLHALFTVFSAQGNVGLNAMPDGLYYGMQPVLKVQLIAHMLLGHIEIFPLLYLIRGLRE
ncbi:MAG: TrkH family potassium uptake protein [Anaerolineae bacterium]|nr:TrkH family potassium uptake protein [Anaerolineae bacterium]